MTQITLIACVDRELAIGRGNDILFKCSEDMQWFKNHTVGKPVIMGRNTYKSIGKPLSDRLNVALTSDRDYNPHPDVIVRHNISEVLQEFKNEEDLMIIGGGKVYEQFLPMADRLILTEVDHVYEDADTFFPKFSSDKWERIFYDKGREEHQYDYSFNMYRRIKP